MKTDIKSKSHIPLFHSSYFPVEDEDSDQWDN